MNLEESQIVRFLSSYRRGDGETDDRIVGRVELNVALDDLLRLFDHRVGDPLMYDPYEVTIAQQHFIEALTGDALDFDRFYYYVECQANE